MYLLSLRNNVVLSILLIDYFELLSKKLQSFAKVEIVCTCNFCFQFLQFLWLQKSITYRFYLPMCTIFVSKAAEFCGEKCKTVPCGQLYRLADWEMDVPRGKVKARLLLSATWCTMINFVRYATNIHISIHELFFPRPPGLWSPASWSLVSWTLVSLSLYAL